jgi:hypothetical protein
MYLTPTTTTCPHIIYLLGVVEIFARVCFLQGFRGITNLKQKVCLLEIDKLWITSGFLHRLWISLFEQIFIIESDIFRWLHDSFPFNFRSFSSSRREAHLGFVWGGQTSFTTSSKWCMWFCLVRNFSLFVCLLQSLKMKACFLLITNALILDHCFIFNALVTSVTYAIYYFLPCYHQDLSEGSNSVRYSSMLVMNSLIEA